MPPVEWACPVPIEQIHYASTLKVPVPALEGSFGQVLAGDSPLIGGGFEATLAGDVEMHPCTVRQIEQPDVEPDRMRDPSDSVGNGAAIADDDPRDGWRVVDHHFVYDRRGFVVMEGISKTRFVYEREAAELRPTGTKPGALTSVRQIIRWPDGAALKEETRDPSGSAETHWCRDARGTPTGYAERENDKPYDVDANVLTFEYDDKGRPVRGQHFWRTTGETLPEFELTWNDRNELTTERSPRSGLRYSYEWSQGRPVKLAVAGQGTGIWSYDAQGGVEITYRRADGSIAGVQRFADGRELSSVIHDKKTGPRDRLKVKLDPRGRPSEVWTPEATERREYDREGREVRRESVDVGGNVLLSLRFGYEGCRPASELAEYFDATGRGAGAARERSTTP